MARVTIDPVARDALIEEMAYEYAATVAPKVLNVMQLEAPIDTGALRRSGKVDRPRRVGKSWVIRFRFKEYYAIYVHQGRGEIRPVRAKALRWVNKAGVVVFAAKARAVPENPFMWRAWQRIGFKNVKRLTGRR